MVVPKEEYMVWAGRMPNTLVHEGQTVVVPPVGWIFVASGDAGLTRRIKAAGDYWLMVHRRRNRIEALGLWADAERVKAAEARLDTERSDPAYLKKRETGRKYREARQEKYKVEFRQAVVNFLAFAPKWSALAEKLADAVTVHAVPVGSGTVARTRQIPVAQRAEAAVIAWMRHQTTVYDHMAIARIKGERREVRRKLAERSRHLLHRYRSGEDVDITQCPLAKALQ